MCLLIESLLKLNSLDKKQHGARSIHYIDFDINLAGRWEQQQQHIELITTHDKTKGVVRVL